MKKRKGSEGHFYDIPESVEEQTLKYKGWLIRYLCPCEWSASHPTTGGRFNGDTVDELKKKIDLSN